jgi:hypothetical protein
VTSRPTSQCGTCARFVSPLDSDDADEILGPTCTAFPAGIPDEIWWNRFDHRQPHVGDGGLRWESNGHEFPEWAMNVDGGERA